ESESAWVSRFVDLSSWTAGGMNRDRANDRFRFWGHGVDPQDHWARIRNDHGGVRDVLAGKSLSLKPGEALTILLASPEPLSKEEPAAEVAN
ncbi:MAG: hypothetical protein AAF961_11110, partial [Planctomycetota bacterium]